MRSSCIRAWNTLLVGLVLGGAPVWAQTGAPLGSGFQPNRDYLALQPFEAIDTASGNLVLTFTDLALPGNAGRPLRFMRTYNNQVEHSDGLKWRFSLAGIPMRVDQPTIPPGTVIADDLSAIGHWAFSPRFTMPDGSLLRTMFQQMSGPDVYRWVRAPNLWQYDRDTRTLYTTDGTRAGYSAEGRLLWIADPFTAGGAEPDVILDWALGPPMGDPGTLTVTQVLSANETRVVELMIDNVTLLPTTMTDTTTGAMWSYERYPVEPPLPASRGELWRVVPPLSSGRAWTFEYQDTPGFGRTMTRLTTPQGAEIAYTYGEHFMAYSSTAPEGETVQTLDSRVVSGATASVPAGTWNFEYYGGSAGLIARLPSGSKLSYAYDLAHTGSGYATVPLLTGAWSLQTRTVTDMDGVTVVESEDRRYDFLKAARPDLPHAAAVLKKRTIVRGPRTYLTESTYDQSTEGDASFSNYHQPSSITESSAGVVRRTTTRTYRPPTALYVAGLPATDVVVAGGTTLVRSWTYDGITGFRLTEVASGQTTAFTSDDYGNLQRITKPNGKWTETTYQWGQVKDATTSEPGYGVNRVIRPDGQVESETRAGRTTTYQYDTLSRVIEVRPPTWPAASATITTYDNATGRLVTVARGTAGVSTEFDGLGRPIGTLDAVTGVRTRTEYDGQGRVYRTSGPYTAAPIWATLAYDALGRVTSETFADGHVRTQGYGPDTVSVTELAGRPPTVFTHMAFGSPDDARLISVTDSAEQTWNYAYNVAGRLTQVTAPDDTLRTWTYATSDPTRLEAETHPESGTTEYQYDAAGVLSQKTDARGTTFTYNYDGLDRLRQVTAGTEVTLFTYEPGSDLRRSATVNGVSSVFSHDAAGRVVGRDDYVDGLRFSSSYTYDAHGRLTAQWYPAFNNALDRRRIGYEYDDANRLFRVIHQNASQDVASNFGYHPTGAVTGYTSGNGVQTTLAYDPNRSWLISIAVDSLWSLQYQNYDGVGNVQSLVDSRPGSSQTFTYDALDRLHTASGPYGPITYEYNAHGNRTPAEGTTYTYEPGTLRLASQQPAGLPAENFTYDNNGNLLTGSAKVFTYTPQNQLATSNVSGTSASYRYDADQWRIKTVSGATTTYSLRGLGGELLTEWKNPGPAGETTDYVYAGTRLVAGITKPWADTSAVYAYIIPDGPPVTVTLGAANMEGYLVFDGVAGQRMSLYGSTSTMTNVTSCNVWVTVWNPDDTKLSPPTDTCFDGTGWNSPHAGFIEPMALPVTGTYLIKIDPNLTASGGLTLNLYTVPPDETVSITPGGSPVTVSLVKPGHNAFLTFAAVAGQRVAVKGSGNTITGHMWAIGCDVWVTIRRPNDTTLNPPGTCMETNPPFTDTVTLPDTGTYALLVDPATKAMGSLTVTLYDVPADLSGPITPDGPAVPLTITIPGQNAAYTFTGTAGQRMAVSGTNASITGHLNFGCDVSVKLLRPTGASLNGVGTCMEGGGFLEPVTLLEDGPHQVFVDPASAATGGLTLALYTVPADGTGTLTINAAPVPVALSPGQNATYTFSGTNGQTVTVRLTGNTMGSVTVQLKRPNGTTQTSKTSSLAAFNLTTVTLSATGTHAVEIDPAAANSGSISVQVTNP